VPVQEDEFWLQLRFLINGRERPWSCRDLLGYCDWFEVRCYRLGGERPRMEGRVGFLKGRGTVTWKFYLALPPGICEIADIDWSALLPQSASELELEFDSVQGRLLLATSPR
jgi:hypothetical protein